MSDFPAPTPASYSEIDGVIRNHQSFLLLSHLRPDGDAIGSQLALGFSLLEMGKKVFMINEDGLPENLAFLQGSELISLPPAEPLDVEVAVALDTATKPRLGDRALQAASRARLWLNIDHHKTNPGYGDINLIDPTSPATGEILYHLITTLGMPLPEETRDSLYVAVATDTGSFRYPATTARTHEMAADLLRRGLNPGEINHHIYNDHPYRRIELMRALLNTLQRSEDGWVAHWELTGQTRRELGLQPDDSEGLIDIVRSIRGVRVAVFFEELQDQKIRVSMRSSDPQIDVCEIASGFGGGGHTLAAGIRMSGPLEQARARVLKAIHEKTDHLRASEIR